MAGEVRARYEERLALDRLMPDIAQLGCVTRLDELAAVLAQQALQRKSLLGRWRKADVAPRGLYIHGGVGRGKTMLMDLFFETVRFKSKIIDCRLWPFVRFVLLRMVSPNFDKLFCRGNRRCLMKR